MRYGAPQTELHPTRLALLGTLPIEGREWR